MLDNQDSISKAHLAAGRAVDQLRRQLSIVLHEDNGAMLGACPVEGLTPGLFQQINSLPGKQLHLLLTAARARHLGLGSNAICVDAQNMALADILTIADPLSDTKDFPKLNIEPVTPSQGMLLAMAKYASLLPAMLAVESTAMPEEWLHVSAKDVSEYWAAPPIDIVPLAKARLPIEGAENATLTCFRTRWGTSTHLALVFGDIAKDPAPLTRIHSSCVTGDILGSLRCDCGDQLKLALAQISTTGSGILLYLHQEGRGIGIANKIRAYQLQEKGYDTYEANLALGFGEDERDFNIAAGILKTLGVQKIRLLTNNPLKIVSIEKAGIAVAERVPLIIKAGIYNHSYLEAKAQKSGHIF